MDGLAQNGLGQKLQLKRITASPMPNSIPNWPKLLSPQKRYLISAGHFMHYQATVIFLQDPTSRYSSATTRIPRKHL